MVTILNRFKYITAFLMSLCVSIMILVGVYIVSMKENPVVLTNDFDNQILTFLPQGWAFFTRNPREAQISVYEVKEEKLYDISQKHSSYKNLFGLQRDASKILGELQMMIIGIKKEEFVNMEWNYQEGIFDKIPQKTITCTNNMNSPLLCKEYLIVFQKPVPWAWSKSSSKLRMKAKAIRIKVNCDGK